MANPTTVFLCRNPHQQIQSEIWRVDGNTRRLILQDEWNWFNLQWGETIATIPMAWFDSIPVATG